ncbi:MULTISPECIES: ribonuclease Z [unclassified Flavobacterium]|uniref:ribonuclease Z n=1 Tax=unclassified Flavobacterium TaxID=196869 RepID=UPI001F12E52A|nr:MULTISPECIES: ribonuclease Z [unclassified Flavobacterium]UMY65383.1 ribonuclease Z [Flavobacterium sp. HJ-32-4]
MQLTILGCYAATPRTFSNPTSQVLEIKNRLFLIDCAEGTQVQLRRNKIKFSRIDHIFISHLHGDHFFGLVGLISSMTLLNRTADLHVYGPKGIKEIILLQLRYADSYTGFGLYFHELDTKESQLIFEDEKVTVTTIPLQHRVYTNGFLFREKIGDRRINPEAVQRYGVHTAYLQNVKDGKDVTLDDGTVVPNVALTFDPVPPKAYAYCSDTVYTETFVELIRDVDVLYHEATFLETEAALAERTMHSTAKQAAAIAQKAGVGQLILGHYSTRYDNIERFREEASEVFPNTQLADDGKVFDW